MITKVVIEQLASSGLSFSVGGSGQEYGGQGYDSEDARALIYIDLC
jgi:hypothetical protein